MRALLAGIAAGLLAFATAPAGAQNAADAQSYPSRPIRLIVPFPAGGPTDILSRVLAQRLSEDWGQGVVVENRPGGNTTIAAMQVAKTAPDGYTLLAAMDTTLVMNPITTPNLPYDALKDFTYITLASSNTSLLTVRAADGPKTVGELIAKAKANPGKLTFGAGILTTRLAGLLFSRLAGIESVLVPYKGSAEVVQGLLTSSVDFIVDGTAASLPLIRSGQFRPLAKLNSRPLSALPDVPPLSVAANMPALGDISTWIGLVAPPGTPRPIVDKIQRKIASLYAEPALIERLERAGISAVSSTSEEFEGFVRSETERWGKVYKESGIKLD
jgi:tripartite-type tricarboxylate transporter receptor subunit TctC